MGRVLYTALSFFGGALLCATSALVLSPSPQSILLIEGYEYPIDHEPAQALADIREAVATRSRQLGKGGVNFRVQHDVWELPRHILGFEVDEERAVRDAAVAIKSELSFWQQPWRASEEKLTGRGPRHAIQLHDRYQEAAARGILEQAAASVDRAPMDAQLLFEEHRILPGQDGLRLSVDASWLRLQQSHRDGEAMVELAIDRIPPQVTQQDLAPVDVTEILASYETSFRGKAGARAVNIRTAARYLNGALILPGEILSFNERVGRRIHGRGFVDAPVIINDELELDVGGGVCQVATTLHAAAVYGDLEVVRRRSHSRPSGYAPLGLDATVIDGKVDLRLRNTFDEPLLVHVSFPSDYRIRVELLGKRDNVDVEHGYTVTHREAFTRRIWYKEGLPAQSVEKKQKGSQGMDVVSVVKIRREDGSTSRKRYFSKYYPVPEVYWLGEGARVSDLTALPEGAKALVVDGEVVESSDAHSGEEEKPEHDVPNLTEADSSSQAGSGPSEG